MKLFFKHLHLFLFATSCFAIGSCAKNEPDQDSSPTRPLSDSSKSITAFIFKTDRNSSLLSDVNGTIVADSIYLTVPPGTDLTNLVPAITITGIKILPGSLIAQDFSLPVQYVVTAEDGTTKTYIVVVTNEQMPATIFISTVSMDTLLGDPPAGKVYALDANTGNVRWIYSPTSGYFEGSPAFNGGVLYTANYNKITAIDTATKKTRWVFPAGKIVPSALFVENGMVYANCSDGYLYAVDEANGNLRWRFAQGTKDTANGNPSSPTIKDGVLYFGSSKDGFVYALDAVTGNLRWKTNSNTAGYSPFYSSASVVDGVVYIGNFYQYLFALNAHDGSVKWAFPSGSFGGGGATVVNGIIYIGSKNGYMYAINASDGTLRWKFYSDPAIHRSPIVYQGRVFFASSGGSNTEPFYALDANDGSLRWKYAFETDIGSDPVAFNGTVYFCSLNSVYAIDVNSGTLKWKFKIVKATEMITASPCIVDKQGHVYYSAISGHLD